MRFEYCVAIWHTYSTYYIIEHKHWERNYDRKTNHKACDFHGLRLLEIDQVLPTSVQMLMNPSLSFELITPNSLRSSDWVFNAHCSV